MSEPSKLPVPKTAVKDAAIRPSDPIGRVGIQRLKKIVVWLLKLAFSVGVLAWLTYKAQSEGLFQELVEHDKNWTLLAAGGFAMLMTLVMQFLRWRLLVRALDLRLSSGEALRLGFMGQLFSLLGVGMLGGDALKTFFLGRQNKGRMTEALTTVLVDRVIGLYGLLMLAGAVCLQFDVSSLTAGSDAERAAVQSLCRLAPWGALAGTIGFCLMLIPGVTTWPAWDALTGIPKVGPMFERLVRSMRMYARRPGSLLLAIATSLAIHVCNALAFYCISLGLPAPVEKPSLMAHAVAALLALATGALPVGVLEVVFNVIYRSVSSPLMPAQQGFLIILAYRLLQMCIATIGLYYYLRGRREVDELLHEAGEAGQPQGSLPIGNGEDSSATAPAA